MMQAQKNTESSYGGVVGASMLGKLGMQGVGANAGGNTGGYQPRMFGAGRANPNTTGTGAELSDQSGVSGISSRSSYAARFGQANPQSNIGSSSS